MNRAFWLTVLWLAGMAAGEGEHWAGVARARLREIDRGRP